MRTYNSTDTTSQKEALLNEIKGNLFEYLVAAYLSRLKGCERAFITSFGGEIKKQFSEYETWLRLNDSELLKALPALCEKTALSLSKRVGEGVDNILVMGKSAGGSHDDRFGEADLLVIKKEQVIPISLKLCKGGAYVNTKSAGLKSFISKYFSRFDEAQEFQKEFTDSVDECFLQMGHELYEMNELDFKGRFDSSWTEAGFSELPGQLDKTMQSVVLNSYYKINQKLYELTQKLQAIDQEKFASSLWPLMGLADPNIIQATCFHSQKQREGNLSRYHFHSVHVYDFDQLARSLKGLELRPLKENISSFEISLGHTLLQIRIKPMNKFTTASYKVNCSIKG